MSDTKRPPKGFIRIQKPDGTEVLINVSHIRCIASSKNSKGNEVLSITYGDGDYDFEWVEKPLKELEELILEASK